VGYALAMLAISGEVFTALSDPTRRGLFERLSREGSMTVRLLTDDSGVSQPAVSKHLGILKHAGLVSATHKGRETHYSARPRGLAPLVDWMTFYSSFWQDRFNRLEDLLKRMDQ
jgi:DNA-binding transcriptional ArsR family regulator